MGEEEAASRQRNPTGLLVEEAFFDFSAGSAVETYLNVCRVASPTYQTRSFMSPDRRFIRESSVFLPFADGDERISHILVYSERL